MSHSVPPGSAGLLLILALLSVSVSSAPAQSSTQPARPSGCILSGSAYLCDKPTFQQALAAAKTFRVAARRNDDLGEAHLRELAVAFGKTEQKTGDPDLTLVLIPTEAFLTPAGAPEAQLGNLLVYARGAEGKRGPLLWAETFSGSSQVPWATVIHGLIQQLKDHSQS